MPLWLTAPPIEDQSWGEGIEHLYNKQSRQARKDGNVEAVSVSYPRLFLFCADLGIPMWQVDAHNIVPCWVASDKLEYGARTIRGKIHRVGKVALQWAVGMLITYHIYFR